jgi:hypothetical protein
MILNNNGYGFNNHFQNVYSHISICDNHPTPSPFTLIYTFGSLKDFENQNEIITPCHHRILNGVYHYGNAPHFSLFSIGNKVGIVETHESVDQDFKPRNRKLDCGLPVSRNSVVLNSWNINYD